MIILYHIVIMFSITSSLKTIQLPREFFYCDQKTHQKITAGRSAPTSGDGEGVTAKQSGVGGVGDGKGGFKYRSSKF